MRTFQKSKLAFACLMSIFIAAISVFASNAQKTSSEDPDIAQREYMLEISQHLGVTCAHCHDVKNFRSDKLPAFRISREHIKLVNIINQHGFGETKSDKKVKADCFMCHRGKLKPDLNHH